MTDSESEKVFFEDKVFHILDGVYKPAEDTFLLADNLSVKIGEIVLDVGTGCGILAILSASKAKQVIALDLNPKAVICTQLNARINRLSKKTDVIRGDMFSPLRKKALFDLIIFNSPYLPTEKDKLKDWIDYAWSGGKEGREVLNRFLKQVLRYLKPSGRILIVQSTLSHVNKTLKKFSRQSFDVRIVAEHKVDFETITLIEATKTK